MGLAWDRACGGMRWWGEGKWDVLGCVGDVGDRLSGWGALEEDMNVLLCPWSERSWHLPVPCFSTGMKHTFISLPRWEVVWGSGDSPSPGAEAGVGRGRDGAGGCGMGSTMTRQEPFEGRVFGRLGTRFLPSSHPISATMVKFKDIALKPCQPRRPKREKPLVLP